MENKLKGIAYKGAGQSPIKAIVASTRRIRREEQRAAVREQRKQAKLLGGAGK
jgi:hypothetical protein